MAYIFDQADISRVQQANDIIEVISEHLTLSKKGREMVGLCPFHEDHRPSMFVNPVKQIFKCFACGAGGNVFTFLQMRENLTFSQAVERLAQRAGIEIRPAKTLKKNKDTFDIDPNELARLNIWADKFFQKCLHGSEGRTAAGYLSQRKINQQSIKTWHLGYAPSGGSSLIQAAKRSKINDKLLMASGFATGRPGSFSDKFVNRLMFVITDVTGRAIGFGGRTLDGIGAKYINSPATALFDKSNCLYGLQQARDAISKSATVVVTEGYTDVIMAHQFGFENVVATLGTSFTEGHARILKRYAKNIILVFDSDTAGIEATNRALEICLSQQIDIKVASVGEGKDPCDYLLTAGKQALAKILESARDVFEFKWNRLTERFEKDNTLIGRKAAISEFLQSIATAAASGNLGIIEKGLIVNRIAGIIGIDAASINSELKRRIKGARRTSSYKLKNQKVVNLDSGDGLFAAAQREILEVLLNEPELFVKVKEKITPGQFDIEALANLAGVLFDTLNKNPQANLAEILSRIQQPELSSLVVRLQQAGQDKGNYQKRVEDSTELFVRCVKEKLIRTDDNQRNVNIEDLAAKAKKSNPYSLGMT